MLPLPVPLSRFPAAVRSPYSHLTGIGQIETRVIESPALINLTVPKSGSESERAREREKESVRQGFRNVCGRARVLIIEPNTHLSIFCLLSFFLSFSLSLLILYTFYLLLDVFSHPVSYSPYTSKTWLLASPCANRTHTHIRYLSIWSAV